MKLAEALIIRSDLQSRIIALKERLIRSSKVQEGDVPIEKPSLLFNELERLTQELIDIIRKINKTNNSTMLTGEKTLSDALTERDVLSQKRKVLSSVIESSESPGRRYSVSEIKMISTINIAKLQKRVDELSREVRVLDTSIQEKNWLTEL